MTDSTVTILNLVDCQQHLPNLATLQYEAIGRHWVPEASIARGQERLKTHLNRDKLPLAMVAIDNDKPIGMACLRETDGIQPGVSPWLGSVVVDPRYRRKGIGEQLIESVKSQARLMGFNNLHLFAFDPTIPSWYATLGWKQVGFDELFGHSITVMCIDL